MHYLTLHFYLLDAQHFQRKQRVVADIGPDIDEDRVYLRRASDYFKFELKAMGVENRDGLSQRQAPGDNNVGAAAYFSQVDWFYNLGFDGNGSGGNYASAFIQRAAVTNSQCNAAS